LNQGVTLRTLRLGICCIFKRSGGCAYSRGMTRDEHH